MEIVNDDPEHVWTAVEGDPERINNLLDPAPSDVQANVDSVADDVDTLRDQTSQFCNALLLSDALSGDFFVCP
jgi:hypothetical protein